jgi:methionyl-tRNA synthetase
VAQGLGADALRYLLLRSPRIAAGGELSGDALIDCYSAELTNGLGNLVARTTAVAANSELAGTVPPPVVLECPFETEINLCGSPEEPYPEPMLDAINSLTRAGNAFVEEHQPWRQASSDRALTLWHALELCRMIGHLISPVLPERSQRLLGQLGVAEPAHWPVWGGYRRAFHVRTEAEPLFPAVAGSRRRRLLGKWEEAAEEASPRSEISAEDFGRLDLRVARIASAQRISTDGGVLLKLRLDLGDEQRVVFSTRLARASAPQALVGRMVVYLANLEPVEIAGFVSKGMVLAARDGETTSLLTFDRAHEPGTVMF